MKKLRYVVNDRDEHNPLDVSDAYETHLQAKDDVPCWIMSIDFLEKEKKERKSNCLVGTSRRRLCIRISDNDSNLNEEEGNEDDHCDSERMIP